MDDREREHPDEGTIHAWLDGALDDGAARAVEAHVASCRDCAERVAEARGLIAGASRIVGALDDTPSGAAPAWGQVPVAPVAPVAAPARGWRLPRMTPARAAIAATVLVALGVSLTYERGSVDSQATSTTAAMQERASDLSTDSAASAPAAPTIALRRDPLLDSAVKRNVAAAQPPRAVEAAPGPTLPVPTVAPTNAVADAAAPARVAAGRAAVRADREVAGSAAPDQLAGRATGTARPADERAVAAANRVDSVTARPPAVLGAAGAAAQSSAAQSRAPGLATGTECYRVESANGVAATWGADALPLVVRIDPAGRGAVLTVAGQATGSYARVTRAAEDSLLLRLQRIGYEGTLALGAAGEARAGVMRSRVADTHLDQVVVTATGAEEPTARRRAEAPAAKRAPTKTAAAPPAAPAVEDRSAYSAAPAVPVVARRIGCPG